MTKLENVKILDMVNGEPIRIEYDGIVYDLVPRIGGYDEHDNVKEAPKFEVGDYVVALPEADEIYGITTTEMKLGKVTHVYSDGDIDVEVIAHTDEVQVGEEFVVTSKYFRKATDEEIRWAKISRKPGEFKKGDIVKFRDTLYEVNEYQPEFRKSDGHKFYAHEKGMTLGENEYWVFIDDVELITPVEQRFDIAAEGTRQ
jgi:hypothetical protein